MTRIQWTGITWNPVLGCWPVSPGCLNCYAAGFAHRGLHEAHKGLTEWKKGRALWNGEVRLLPSRLEWPLHWKKRQRIFVCSESDLFHEDVPFEFIMAVFSVMARAEQQTFQVLTKRPERMLEFVRVLAEPKFRSLYADRSTRYGVERYMPAIWPVSNVWLGVSVEDQSRADERIPLLLQTPAAVRFLSVEPLLGPVKLRQSWRDYLEGWDTEPRHVCGGEPEVCRQRCPEAEQVQTHRVDWIIVGGESGRNARRCDVEWIRDVVRQCREGRVACFVKQLGARPMVATDLDPLVDYPPEGMAWSISDDVPRGHAVFRFSDSKGGDPAEWPADLRTREFPDA